MRATENRPQTRGFGVFEVDERAAELRKRGVRIKLQEQPFRILCLLLDHSGQVVTRGELRQNLWPAHTFVDFDRASNKAMTNCGPPSEIRRKVRGTSKRFRGMDIAFWPRCTTITKGRKWQLFRAALPFEASQELLPEKMKSPAASIVSDWKKPEFLCM